MKQNLINYELIQNTNNIKFYFFNNNDKKLVMRLVISIKIFQKSNIKLHLET